MKISQSRRNFLAGLSAAGAAGVLGSRGSLADEGPPETTTIRIFRDPSICIAPGYISEELLRAEGFADIRYVSTSDYDFKFESAAWVVSKLAAGEPVTALAGLHPGCYELFAHEPIRTISDLKGKRVGITWGGGSHMFLSIMVAHVGLDPHQDIDWVTAGPGGTPKQLFVERQVDAFLGFPPEPQELRAREIGRVILNMTTDKPWSQYFCCIAHGTRDFVQDHPVATKRFLRAILKADFNPEDSMRFYALRLHEVGMVESSPNAILAEGTDWRFLNELKRELKA